MRKLLLLLLFIGLVFTYKVTKADFVCGNGMQYVTKFYTPSDEDANELMESSCNSLKNRYNIILGNNINEEGEAIIKKTCDINTYKAPRPISYCVAVTQDETPSQTNKNTELENRQYMLFYFKTAKTLLDHGDYEDGLKELYKALPYAIEISQSEVDKLNAVIEDIQIKVREQLRIEESLKFLNDFFKDAEYCQNILGKKSYGSRINGNLECMCLKEYSLDAVSNKCVPSSFIKSNQVDNSELQNSVTRMYNNGLTSFQTVTDFNGDGELTREQASKFFTQFTKIILGKNPDKTQIVKLSDLNKADKTLQPFITESNQLGLFKGVDGKFYPFNKLTRAQAIAVLMRAKDGYQNETNGKRYSEYYYLADSYGLLKDLGFDFETLDSTNIKRKEIALMLYRLGSK